LQLFFVIPEQVVYTTRTITVPSTLSSVADINFNVSLTHSYLSDVEMEVISPQGTTVKLFDRSCGNKIVLLLSYDDSGLISHVATSLQTVVPFQALAAFNGENLKDWSLE
jgi:subtilisin-like proprotein convertase family protein